MRATETHFVTYPTCAAHIYILPQERARSHENKHTWVACLLLWKFLLKKRQQVTRLPKMLHRSIFFSPAALINVRQLENSSHHREKDGQLVRRAKSTWPSWQINPPGAPSLQSNDTRARTPNHSLAPFRVFSRRLLLFPPLNPFLRKQTVDFSTCRSPACVYTHKISKLLAWALCQSLYKSRGAYFLICLSVSQGKSLNNWQLPVIFTHKRTFENIKWKYMYKQHTLLFQNNDFLFNHNQCLILVLPMTEKIFHSIFIF